MGKKVSLSTIDELCHQRPEGESFKLGFAMSKAERTPFKALALKWHLEVPVSARYTVHTVNNQSFYFLLIAFKENFVALGA